MASQRHMWEAASLGFEPQQLGSGACKAQVHAKDTDHLSSWTEGEEGANLIRGVCYETTRCSLSLSVYRSIFSHSGFCACNNNKDR